jgi:hypothetical protein
MNENMRLLGRVPETGPLSLQSLKEAGEPPLAGLTLDIHSTKVGYAAIRGWSLAFIA